MRSFATSEGDWRGLNLVARVTERIKSEIPFLRDVARLRDTSLWPNRSSDCWEETALDRFEGSKHVARVKSLSDQGREIQQFPYGTRGDS